MFKTPLKFKKGVAPIVSPKTMSSRLVMETVNSQHPVEKLLDCPVSMSSRLVMETVNSRQLTPCRENFRVPCDFVTISLRLVMETVNSQHPVHKILECITDGMHDSAITRYCTTKHNT